MNLNNKVCIITGAANPHGIGFATAKKFLEYGAENVYLIDIATEVKSRATELQTATGGKVEGFTGDVSDFKQMKDIVTEIYNRHGRVDVLVNNAAVNIPGDTIEASIDEWELHYNVNVKSHFIMSKLVLPYMREQKDGAIVNMSSGNAIVAEKQLVSYVGTKGAIKQQTMADALDNAIYGIRINAIGPGLVHTGFNDPHHNKVDGGRENIDAHILDIQPTGRPVEAEEVANMALFLASDLAKGCIGGFYLVDGGYSIK